MVSIKDLIGDLGGGRSLSIGAVLVVCCYVAATRYVDSVEARITDLEARARILEAAKQRYDAFEASGRRFTGEQGDALDNRISRIERQLDARPR